MHLAYLNVFVCFCHIFTVFVNDNGNREKITHESCDDREFREVVGIGVSKDRYNNYCILKPRNKREDRPYRMF